MAAQGLVVRFGATLALKGVDLDVRPGEVHAVVGENGAGKSSLLRAIVGIVRPAAGAVRVRTGARVAWVPQETELPPDLTAAEWIFLGEELCDRLGWLQDRAMRSAAQAALERLGSSVDPGARLGALSAPQRKQVQLARALRTQPDALLLDEPTAVLAGEETRQLFAAVRTARGQGAGVLYVSHRLEEVLVIADRVTVLRDGVRVSTDAVDAVDVSTLVRRMVGRDVPERTRVARPLGPAILRLADVTTGHVRGLSLTVRTGEIVGLAGLVGSGRSAVLETIAGLRRLRAGSIECDVEPVLVPEDRARKGLVRSLCVRENVFLPADRWRLRLGDERCAARHWVDRLAIRTAGVEAPIDALSGGNQQKLLLARALRHSPRLLLLDEPTAGVDVAVKAEIHDCIRQLADQGGGVLLASSDLPELLVLCDRVVALYRGEAAGELAAEDATEERLATLITGGRVSGAGCQSDPRAPAPEP